MIASFSVSSLDSMERNKEMLDRRDLNMVGEDSRIESAWDEVVANIAGREAEKTDAEELIRCTC